VFYVNETLFQQTAFCCAVEAAGRINHGAGGGLFLVVKIVELCFHHPRYEEQ